MITISIVLTGYYLSTRTVKWGHFEVKYKAYPSEAHAMAGRRPAVARSERSERSVHEALLQKIDLF